MTIVFIIVIFLVNSCSSDKKVKIGMLLPNMTDARWPQDLQYFSAKVNELGGEVLSMDAQNNDQLQITQAEELISKGAKMLVVIPVNKNSAAMIVRYAHSKNVKVLSYERIISNCDLDYFISFDNVKVGELMASYAVKLKPEGNYVLLNGDKSDQNAVWVRKGFHNVLDTFVKVNRIKIAYDVYVDDWSGEEARDITKKYVDLSGTFPEAILSAYDGMSTGIITALDERHATIYPVVTGQNAEIEACRNIIKGKQSMTIYKPIKKIAEEAAVIVLKSVRNEKQNINRTISNGGKDVPTILIEPVPVDASTMKATVIADGFLAEKDIYQ